MPVPIIVFLSDFGLQDPYVGVVKGVIAGICPRAKVIDLTHEIPAGDIRRAAVMLWQCAPYFPSGAIYLGVVDPGVGTQRKGLIYRTAKGIFVGPDNGLASYLWMDMDGECWEINQLRDVPVFSNTFHGRDIFAPVAAHLAEGVSCESIGISLSSKVTLEMPALSVKKKRILGEILYADHFGNMITSIGRLTRTSQPGWWELTGWGTTFHKAQINLTTAKIDVDQKTDIAFVNTYADAAPGSICALVGSSGLVEIVFNQASAASILKIRPGEQITLTLPE